MFFDPIPDTVQNGIYTKVVGQRIYHFPKVDSTMMEASRLIATGVPEGTVVLASEQTQGRGRFHRSWKSRIGDILMSVVFYPRQDIVGLMSVLGCLAVVRAIRDQTGISAKIKWPNDILINDKKVCGILVESSSQNNNVKYCILGLGLNVTMDPSTEPDIAERATSLLIEYKKNVNQSDLIRSLFHEIDMLYSDLKGNVFPLIEWKNSVMTIGENVTAIGEEGSVCGLAEGIDDSGRLLIRKKDGTLIKLLSGEVSIKTNNLGS